MEEDVEKIMTTMLEQTEISGRNNLKIRQLHDRFEGTETKEVEEK